MRAYFLSVRLLLGGAIAALIPGCASFSTFTSARTLPQGQYQAFVAPCLIDVGSTTYRVSYPNGEFGVRYGLTDRVELGAKIWVLGAMADAKVQILRAPEDKLGIDLAAAPGLGYAGFALATGGSTATSHTLSLYLPLIVGLNLPGGSELYVSPRLVEQVMFTGGAAAGPPADFIYLGGSVGFSWKVARALRLVPEISAALPIALLGPHGAATPYGTSGWVVQPGLAIVVGP